MQDLYSYLKAALPQDHSRQVNATMVLKSQISKGLNPQNILDFGCGDGRSYDLFKRILPDSNWCGVDIEISPEVSARTRTDAKFVSYDGETLPFEKESYDLVYSHQVLEHVRYPDTVFKEIHRVLQIGGYFIGQTSQFEPYHSYSMWNFTIYGFKRIVEEAGLKLIEIRPSIDGFTLMERTRFGKPKEYSKYFSAESPLNQQIEDLAISQNKSHKIINHRKLQFCGQFCFVISKV